ncbi:MAG: hypothetical protein IKV86_04860 [Clostridia bacterium]|nr:hypothetical protein [Clostridia bacterium]
MNIKRVTLFAGHYGSGKTNIAVNWAKYLKSQNKSVTIVDLDIVNPYFRTKDSQKDFEELGIKLVCSEYANTNLDIPALPREIYGAIADKSSHLIMDIGGDDVGAVAMGRYTPSILEENDYEMLYVANCFRPLTKTAEDTLEVMREIEAASGIPFTGIVNNSNLGVETTPEDVVKSNMYAQELSKISKLPVVFTTVNNSIAEKIGDKIPDLFPLELQKNKF